jgi:hypothetical protein
MTPKAPKRGQNKNTFINCRLDVLNKFQGSKRNLIWIMDSMKKNQTENSQRRVAMPLEWSAVQGRESATKLLHSLS